MQHKKLTKTKNYKFKIIKFNFANYNYQRLQIYCLKI